MFINVCTGPPPSRPTLITFHREEHLSFFSRAVHVGSEHPLEGKGNGDEEKDGADGAGLVVDDEVRGVENQQQ